MVRRKRTPPNASSYNRQGEKHGCRSWIEAGARPPAVRVAVRTLRTPAHVTKPGARAGQPVAVGLGGVSTLVGWVAGVAGQLQQIVLWPVWGYVAFVCSGLLVAWWHWRLPTRSFPVAARWLLLGIAGFCLAWGQTGWRAAVQARHALAADHEGADIRVEGRVASLPQIGDDSLRFELVVASAEMAGNPVRLPERLQLAWYRHGRGKVARPEIPPVHAGERWRLTVRLRSPHSASNPHGFDR